MQFNDATKAFWRYLVGKDIGINEINDDDTLRMWMELDGISGDIMWPGSTGDSLSLNGYGIDNTGATDNTAAWAKAIANAKYGDRIVFGRGTFRFDSGLTIPSGVSVDASGATLDFTNMPDGVSLAERVALKATGTIGGNLTIANPIAQWDRVITGISSTAGLAAGDLILLRNDERPVPGMSRTDRDKGELQIIQSVDSGTQVTLTSGVLFAYGTTSLVMQKITPVQDIRIRGGKWLMGGINSAHVAFRFQYGKNIRVDGAIIDGAEDTAISMNTIYDYVVNVCSIANSTSNAGIGNTGYGVAAVEGSRFGRITNNAFYNCRHFVAGGGFWPAVFTKVSGNQGERSSDAAYDCHESTFYWDFIDNDCIGVASGFIIRGQYINIERNRVTDSLGRSIRSATFDGVTEQRGIRIVGNTCTRSTYGIEVDGQAAGAEPNCQKIDIEISRNTLRDCGPNPILLRHFLGAKLDGNKIYGSTNHALLCLGLASGTPSSELEINNCSIDDSGLDAIKCQFVDDLVISGAVLRNVGTTGIELLTCNRTAINFPDIRVHQQNGIFVSAGGTHSLTGGHITGGVGATFDAVRFSGTTDVAVSGGYYSGPRYGINSTTTDWVSIIGTNCRAAVGSAGVKINCDAANKAVPAGSNLV